MSSINTSSTNGRLQITGLASGLDTNSIVNALINAEKGPITAATNKTNVLTTQDNALSAIQSALRSVSLNSLSLHSPGLYSSSQQVTSTNPGIVGATAKSSAGAVVGGYSVVVNNLASASQKTFSFASPTADAQIAIDGGTPYTIKQGSVIGDLVNQINSDSSASVWATATDAGTLVLSDRATGSNGTSAQYIQVAAQGGTTNPLTETAHVDGQNANLTVNGKTFTPSTNSTSQAIPGVTLSLNGTTGATPVSINVAPPAPSTDAISSALGQFVSSYNSSLSTIQAQLTQKSSKTDLTQGVLFGDSDLSGLVGRMRTSIYAPDPSLKTGYQSLADIGISTGSSSGQSSQNAVSGQLQIDQNKLNAAIQNDPGSVKALLQSFSGKLQPTIDSESGFGKSIDARINGNKAQISDLAGRIATKNEILNTRKNSLLQTFAKLEAAMSAGQNQSAWLSSQIAGLRGF